MKQKKENERRQLMTDRSVMKGDTEADRESVWWRYVRIETDKDRMEDSSREIEREMLA